MKLFLISLILYGFQTPLTVVKNNGDESQLNNFVFYQSDTQSSASSLTYSYRGQSKSIALNQVKRISFKESVRRKKGVTTYRVILVKTNNDKLEVEMNLAKLEGKNKNGKTESIGFGSIDKISF